jgi:hypothetical protein
MRRPQWGWYAVALAILVVGLVWAGVPANTLLVAGLFLTCPLMMFFMMRGMHGPAERQKRYGERGNPDHPDDLHGVGRG